MKVTKLPGFGSYGALVEDFEWDQPEAYRELRDINLKSLLTIVKGNGADNFPNVVKHCPHNLISRRPYRLVLKYGTMNFKPLMSEDESIAFKHATNMSLGSHAPGWHRVTGQRNDDDEPMGLFGETVLNWHSNEMMSNEFQPLVTLYGVQNMSASATSFVQTADWYENQTESFKSELNELVAVCVRNVELITPGVRKEDLALATNLRPDIMRMPLVFDSPGKIRGLHYNLYMTKFEGMSQEDSDKILNKIKSEVFESANEFPWWWSNDHEWLLFDNTICMHRRIFEEGIDIPKRLVERVGYRISSDYAGLREHNGYLLPEFREKYDREVIEKLRNPTW